MRGMTPDFAVAWIGVVALGLAVVAGAVGVLLLLAYFYGELKKSLNR